MNTSLRLKINQLVQSGISSSDIEAVLLREFPDFCIKPSNGASIRTRKELIHILQLFQPEPVIELYRQKSLNGKSTKSILRFTMDGSIYRAFHHETPSLRFNKCSWHSDPDQLIKKLDDIKDQESFDIMAFQLADVLIKDWGEFNDNGYPTRMNKGIAMKITNLALKHLTFSGHCGNTDLKRFLHVLWDSFTLKPLRYIWKGNPAIPTKAGQGFVNTLSLYKELHNLITEITGEAGIPRINYEFWAWDATH